MTVDFDSHSARRRPKLVPPPVLQRTNHTETLHKQVIWIACSGFLVAFLSLCLAVWSIFSTQSQFPNTYTADEQEEIDKFCAEYGTDVKAVDENGGTLLHTAIRSHKNDAVIRFLVSKGADIYAKDKAGFTPLDLAKESSNTAIQNYCKSLAKKSKKSHHR
jgi:ankyrin repeat protein